MSYHEKKCFQVLLLFGILLNATGLLSEIMEPDAALYASIAKHIVYSGDWVQLIAGGRDWLDKPHLPFWLAAASFKLFGINAFAYKFPAFICWMVGVWYTFRLAENIYNERVAWLSCIIYVSSMHAILANTDVRAEAYLTAFIIAAIFHLYRLMDDKWTGHFIAGAFFCALAMMTKGVFVLMTILSGFVIYWTYYRRWKEFFQLKYWMFLFVSFIFILPEIYCLYQQFDLHPDKIVFGKTSVSGIRFYFWDSQFGRFFNNGPIKGEGDVFFFLHTLLWAFLPWSPVVYVAVYYYFVALKNRVVNEGSLILIGSVGMSFLIFSLSKFQLPHYIIIVFPLLSMLVAAYLHYQLKPIGVKRWKLLLTAMFVALLAMIGLLIFLTGFNKWYWPTLLILLPASGMFYFSVAKQNRLMTLIIQGMIFSTSLFFYLNFFFFPALLKYQSGMQAGKWLQEQQFYQQTVVVNYQFPSWSFAFYGPENMRWEGTLQGIVASVKHQAAPVIVYTREDQLAHLQATFKEVKLLKSFQNFHVSQLNMEFLVKNKREKVLENYLLLRCK